MAGYDLTFVVPARYRSFARRWLGYVQRSGAVQDLTVTYQTRLKGRGRVECNVLVDGKLPEMQHLAGDLPNLSFYFLRAEGRYGDIARQVIVKFLLANRKSVHGLTRGVFEIAGMFGGRPQEFVLSNAVMGAARSRKVGYRERASLGNMIHCVRNWRAGDLPDGEAVVLCDQALEQWIKARLHLSRASFQEAIKEATVRRLVSPREAWRLRLFHRTRNRVQHEGERVRRRSVFSMLAFVAHFLNVRYAP